MHGGQNERIFLRKVELLNFLDHYSSNTTTKRLQCELASHTNTKQSIKIH